MKAHHVAIGAIVIDFLQWAVRQLLLGEGESLIIALLQQIISGSPGYQVV